MRRVLRTPASWIALLAVAILVVAGGGYAVASSSGGGTVQACAKKSNGALRVAKKCKKSEKRVTWAVQGPAGVAGAPGANGLNLFARVDETGALHQHSAGVTAVKNSSYTGIYEVHFVQDISACTMTVSAAQASNNGYVPGAFYQAKVMSDPNNTNDPHTIQVYSYRYDNNTATSVNAPFALIVAC